jgi:hypothetical protein
MFLRPCAETGRRCNTPTIPGQHKSRSFGIDQRPCLSSRRNLLVPHLARPSAPCLLELREHIYALTLFPANDPSTLRIQAAHYCRTRKPSMTQPALCFTNKQVRAESLSFFYSQGSPTMDLSSPYSIARAAAWLCCIGDHNV